MLLGTKSLFASKTFWGGVIGLVSAFAGINHYSISSADAANLVELCTSISSAIGSVIAIYGRITATKQIT